MRALDGARALVGRRAVSLLAAAALSTTVRPLPSSAAELKFIEAGPPGFSFADAKPGKGVPFKSGQRVSIDYVMSTTGARYGAKIDSTVDRNEPYAWTLGDGSTIAGLELAIVGDESAGVPPMLPGGVRRVIIPSSLGYEALAKPIPGMQFQNCQEGRGPGPIPPELTGAGEGAYQRFKNIYCNANRPYQPDLVLDIKLYGKREAKTVAVEDSDETED